MKDHWTWTCECGFDGNRNTDSVCQKCRKQITCAQAGGHHDFDGDGLCDRGCGTVLDAHRALTDVHILVQLLMQVPDLEQQITEAPTIKEYASDLPFAKKELLKSASFNWNPDIKKWTKKLTQRKYDELKDSLNLFGLHA